jgi:hypothetical protein
MIEKSADLAPRRLPLPNEPQRPHMASGAGIVLIARQQANAKDEGMEWMVGSKRSLR